MTTPGLTLNSIRKSLGNPDFNGGDSTTMKKGRVVRVSDFVSEDSKEKILAYRAQKAQKRRGFDEIDAYSAEILGRFGYEAWKAWQNFEIDGDVMARMVMAERAREKRSILGLESIIVAAVAGANHPTKNGYTPKTLRSAVKMLKKEEKMAMEGLVNG